MFRKLSSCTFGLMLVSAAAVVHAQDTSQTLSFGILSTESSPSFKQD